MSSSLIHVRVGVGCFVRHIVNNSLVLVGKRKGSHGAGTLALPGGHLEMGESWEDCIKRELLEETNLLITNIKHVGTTNDISINGNPNKHYITIFMSAYIHEESGPLENKEPDKCEGWEWISMEDLHHISMETPHLLFDPLLHYLQNYGNLPE